MDEPPALSAALAWAARGIPALPIRTGGKAPLTRHGLHDASTDPHLLRAWWAKWPGGNVAIATGAIGDGGRGVDVLDVDVHATASGWRGLRRLREAGIVPDGVPIVRTPSSGAHLYFIGTDQRNGSVSGEHVDFRATGGYVLVPPSQITTDTYDSAYQWERRGEPTSALDWQAAVDLLRPPLPEPVSRGGRPPRAAWSVGTLAAYIERQPEGNRNNLLFWAFCTALRSGYNDLRPIADAALRNRGGEPMTLREIEATWRQALKRMAVDGCEPRAATVAAPPAVPSLDVR